MKNWNKFMCPKCGKNQEITGRRLAVWRGARTFLCATCLEVKNEKAQ